MNDPKPDVSAPAKPGPVTLRNRMTAILGGTHCVLPTEPAWGSASA
ncbi:hypothetical protein [Actinomadura chokoriensis]|uniref:Uncharacterized protein n=1 Tax=Actinomadura chokoriensis TaxID=454156 RepID=A0ABV4QYS4_9ACTN